MNEAESRDRAANARRFVAPEFVVAQIDVVNDFADRAESGVLDTHSLEQNLERAAVAVIREFGVVHVEAKLSGLGRIAFGRNELERRVRIDETANEPSARDPVDVDASASHPCSLLRPG